MKKERPPFFASILILLIVALIVSFFVWAHYTQIDEIARGSGKVIPASRTQTIQSSEPGVIKEIAVQVGELVKKGQLIVRLDDTTSASNLGEVEAQARSLEAQIARLKIEESGDFEAAYECPESVAKVAPSICKNEENLLAVNREAYRNNVDVLRQRLIQREKDLDEALANVKRLKGALEISKRELDLLTPMVKDKLVAETDLIKAQRDVNDYSGQLDSVTESIDRLKGAVEEAKLQVRNVLLKYEQDALSSKTDALAKLSVLREQARGESTKVARNEIRSPVEGVINTLEVNTLGAFVQPGGTIAEIVPTSEELLVEARISPRDIAFVHSGQEALVKITAFDFSIYGGLEGKVINVSSDSLVDQKTGEPYFEVRVKTTHAQLERAGKYFKITPGMVCTVDIKTGRKSILHYLLKPINKARQEALTER